MKTEQIDEFLFIKAKGALDRFFEYIQPGLDLSIRKELTQSSEEIIEGFKQYGKDVVLFQVNASSFILDIFHSIELYMKSVLFKNGEYLVFKSIDDYPKDKLKWIKRKKERQETIETLHKKMLLASEKGKEDRANKLAKELGPLMINEKENLLVHSVSATEAMHRLAYYLNWDIAEDFKKRFDTLVDCRNDVIHFGAFDNISFACSAAISCLSSLSKSLPKENYPMFSTLADDIKTRLPAYNEFIQYVKYFEIEEPFFNQLTNLLSKKETLS